jgi:hypothetical protein
MNTDGKKGKGKETPFSYFVLSLYTFPISLDVLSAFICVHLWFHSI